MSEPTSTIAFAARKRKLYYFLAAMGASLVLLQVVLSIALKWSIDPWAMLASACVGFWGFHGLDPASADKAADTLSGVGVSIITAIRGGRRKTDAVVAVTADVVPETEIPPEKTDGGNARQ